MKKLVVNLLVFAVGGACIFLICCLLGGCDGSCITIGGSYKDNYSGDFTWCFDVEKSKVVGVPVITEETEDSKKEFFGYSLDEIKKIIEKMGLGDIGIKKAEMAGKHPAKQLKEILEGD